MLKRLILGVVLLYMIGSNPLFSAPIDKAFSALKAYNYFEAKRLFEKALKKSPSPARFGLATIYFRKDNPFHHLDSALNCIQLSEKSYATISEKSKLVLKKYNFDYFAIIALRNEIGAAFFELERIHLSETSLDHFQEKFDWAQERFLAIHLRDSLGFNAAKTANNSRAFELFLKKYPTTEYLTQATAEFQRLQYQEITKPGTLVAFMNFEKSCPTSPYLSDAQDQIYKLATLMNSVADYNAFIQTFPHNKNVPSAWRKLYQLYMADYSSNRLAQFQADYPNYPFQDEINRDVALNESIIIPYKVEGKFGWMNESGEITIPAVYGSVGFFKEGLAWAEKNDKYGYVNKVNEVVIPFIFESANDFEKGRAVVEVDGKYGLIDRSGTFIIPAEFEDLGTYTEELIYAQKDSLYGYFDGYGNQRIPAQYDEAFSFSNGRARVTLNGLEGFIDPFGAFLVKPIHTGISVFSDSIYTYEDGDFIKFFSNTRTEIPHVIGDYVGKLVQDRAVLVSDGKVGYLDPTAKLVIGMNFDEFTNCESEGAFQGKYAKVCKGGKFGVIDRSGKIIVPIQYPFLGMVGDLIAFEKNGKWGYIDLSNKVVIQPTYELAESFMDGSGIVQLLTLKGTINSKGQVVIPIAHTTINKLDPTHYLVSIGANYGIYSDKGKLLVPLEYNQIRKIQDEFYLLTKGQEMHYFSVKEDRIIQPNLNE
jgi:hypothetical protein